MEGLCRGCLLQHNEPTELLQYTEKNRRLFVYSTGLQVKRNDTFTFQLCKECYFNMKQSCKFKKQCRTSDKHFKNYLLLKEDGDDFGTFIKNMDENLALRLPMASGTTSTPAYQKNKDDDNESTCTSIRNFIADILEGEEVPPAEARLVRELIQEETDVLDDSLDSHWLQDDRSVGSDFDVDFGISPFTTPRAIENDHCYTPRRIVEAKQREINYLTSKEIMEKIEKPGIAQKYDMPLLEDMNMDYENVEENKNENYVLKKDDIVEHKRELNEPDLFEFDNSIPSEVEDMVTENSISSTLHCFKTDLLDLAVKKEMDIVVNDNLSGTLNEVTFDKDTLAKNENSICIVLNQGIAENSIDKVPLNNELEYYVNKAEIKKRITSTKDKTKYHCTIDRNLDIALKYEGSQQFALDQLITSPAESIRSSSGVSTPTITSILFGDKNQGTEPSATSTPIIQNILFGDDLQKVVKYFPQVGQSLDNLEDDKSDNILKDFLQDEHVLKDDEITEINIKIEPKDNEMNFESVQCNPSTLVMKHEVIKSEEVLEEFLRGANDDKLNKEIIDQIIDPLDLNSELSDQDLFKRPLTPPYDKYDLENCLCKLCNRTFISTKSLKIHFAKIHKYKLANLDPHRNKSQNIKSKLCNICGKAVKGAANYSRHMKQHQDKCIEFFQCDNCKLFFKNRMALQVHMRMHMGIKKKQKKFVCPTCGKASATSSHHKLHIRRHLKQISATCDVCRKGFYSAYDLKAHKRIHSGERPYVCKYCPKAFRRRNELHLHMKRHMGKLEFKCDACNMEFVSKEILATHYASQRCIRKRELMSRKSNKDSVSVKSAKGSLEKIRKIMQSTKPEKDIESDNEEMENIKIQLVEIENPIIQPAEIENTIIQAAETENIMMQAAEIENTIIQPAEI